MPQYIRPKITGACVFFTVVLARRGSDLLLREVDRLRAAVAMTKQELPFDIDAWVVLPDHLHSIWTLPQGDADFALRWRLIKARFSHGLDARPASASKRRHAEKGIWQRRYWDHHIRNPQDYQAHVHYCWQNPVKHGLVSRAIDWPLSSIHRDVRSGRVAAEWGGRIPEGEYGE